MRVLSFLGRPTAVAIVLTLAFSSVAQVVQPPFPVKRIENADMWRTDGWNAIDMAKRQKIRTGKAKNVILFLGDGLSNATIAASRIFEAQQTR